MTPLLDFNVFSASADRIALERLARDPQACIDDYRKVMREIPNLHLFFRRVQSYFPHREEITRVLWYRIWAACKSDEDAGRTTTLDMLRKTPDMDKIGFVIEPKDDLKLFTYCFEMLHRLIAKG
jgi:hypothetical protein